MKKFFILIILATGLFIESVSAQDDNGNLIYPTNFNVKNDQLSNGRIKFDSSSPVGSVGISGTCGMIVSGIYKNFVTKIIAQVVLIDKDGVVKHSAPSMEFYKSDFMINGVMTQISIAKPFEFNVGRGTMSGGYLELRYKYEFDAAANIPNLTQSGWAPAVTHNKEWFIHNKKYETIDLARTTFTGPNSICNEETYTLVSPGAITLENAANVATLTRIDNNTYKITRIGSANGIVTLKSVFNRNAYSKEIYIGGSRISKISGPTTVYSDQEYQYQLEFGGVATGQVTRFKASGTFLQDYTVNGNYIKIQTKPMLNNMTPKQILIEAVYQNECGLIESTNLNITAYP
ncbi:Uncharacterised protein [Sphingobacterium spiritivorum]|uniref:Uncharacterized protein n=1 Tax=Sphingobacterium spiritivorum TaxID=258 RepID=A0A380BAV6_SPHSI|nr:hypothetical protein [Sphingobacterium spiritivorum]SUI97850.1 Uncharacterised protein [Sphingobacterium spiritivorum]